MPQGRTFLSKFLRIGFFQICTHGLQVADRLSRSHTLFQVSKRLKNPVDVSTCLQTCSVHLLLVDDRHKEIWRDELQRPLEPWRRHADDGERMLVELDGTAH